MRLQAMSGQTISGQAIVSVVRAVRQVVGRQLWWEIRITYDKAILRQQQERSEREQDNGAATYEPISLRCNGFQKTQRFSPVPLEPARSKILKSWRDVG
jgi:hypothetical protein